MNQYWNERLSAGYRAKTGQINRSGVRLPAEQTISVTGDEEHAVITLRPDACVNGRFSPGAVVCNMQDNGSAFEGWSLALHYWCGVDVTLIWELPAKDSGPNDDTKALQQRERHHQRFLYRVERFDSLFEWFHVGYANSFAASCVVNNPNTLFLNVQGKRPTSERPIGNGDLETMSEHELENRLLHDARLLDHYKIPAGSSAGRQFPVGLFSNKSANSDSRIFPGSKGAIDLVILDSDHVWIFELKAKKNISIGIISESIFYTSVIRDAAIGKFVFCDSKIGGSILTKEVIKGISKITGGMLGPDLHPLLADASLLDLLNDAVNEKWNSHIGAPAVNFRAGKIIRMPLDIADVD
jgi:hypothetical protein